ncbi:12292_t:CDS:2, partial [Entrophospora sp. SA101]
MCFYPPTKAKKNLVTFGSKGYASGSVKQLMLVSKKRCRVILTGLSSIVLTVYLGMKTTKARKVYGVEYPYSTLTIGGLKHPIISAVAGGVWIIGRIAYAVGYSTGEPDKRHRGGFGYFGSLALVGTTIS